MKTLRISRKEIINLQPHQSWVTSFDTWSAFWIETQLKLSGFNMKKEIISYEDFKTMHIVFEQEEQ